MTMTTTTTTTTTTTATATATTESKTNVPLQPQPQPPQQQQQQQQPSLPPPPPPPPPPPSLSLKTTSPVNVGQKLEVLWPTDDEYYLCTVVDYSQRTGRAKVIYPRNNNAVEEFVLAERTWRLVIKHRGRPLRDALVGKHIELKANHSLSETFRTKLKYLRCYVIRRAGPARYDLLYLASDRIAKSQNIAGLDYKVVDPNTGRNQDIIVEPLSDDNAATPASPKSDIHSNTSEVLSRDDSPNDDDAAESPQLSSVTARGSQVIPPMPLLASPPPLMLETAPIFPPPHPPVPHCGLFADDSVDGDDEGSEFDAGAVLDFVAAGGTVDDNEDTPANFDSADEDDGNEDERRREEAARAAVHRFVSVAQRPDEPRRLAYVLGYESSQKAHKLAWIESVDSSDVLLTQGHEILDDPPIRKRSTPEGGFDNTTSGGVLKRPRSEALVGKWISVRDDPALVVGERGNSHLVYFARDERIEELQLNNTRWCSNDPNVTRKFDVGGLVGKRIVVLDKGDMLFEAFVVERIGSARYRLLYTYTGMMLVEDLRNRDRHWDIVPYDTTSFRGRKIVAWSRGKRT